MTRRFLILFVVSIFFKTQGQSTSKCECEALINFEFQNEIFVYDKPNGKITKKLKHNFKDENFLVLTIHNDTSDFLQVDIFYALTESNGSKGWIEKSNVVGTYAKNYSPKQPLNLYSKPNIKSKIQSIVPEWTNRLYVIDRCFGKWAYVKIKYRGQQKEGWLEPDKQCASQYTTCN